MMSIQHIRQVLLDVAYQYSLQEIPSDIVVFAVDGISFELAKSNWVSAEIVEMRSTFPSTSSTAWLSSLAGSSPEQHGVPGVEFIQKPAGATINVFSAQDLEILDSGNLFSDVKQVGYSPWVTLGDLTTIESKWKNVLTGSANLVPDKLVVSDFIEVLDNGAKYLNFERLLTEVEYGVELVKQNSELGPVFHWLFIDIDSYVHRNGYDSSVIQFLFELDQYATKLVRDGCAVIAYSDHGLVPTSHDNLIAELFCKICVDFACNMGGAGRTRWFYTGDDSVEQVMEILREHARGSFDVYRRSELFEEDSRFAFRIGEVVVVATEERFITENEFKYDHGSMLLAEMQIPFANWSKPAMQGPSKWF